MTFPKAISSDQELSRARSRIEELKHVQIGTHEHNERKVLSALINQYESESWAQYPDLVAAIKARMEQANLTNRDLVPIIGSRSKVSEVLSGSRTITIPMARALHKHLGIPAEVLLKEPEARERTPDAQPDWQKFPIREMAKHEWCRVSDSLKDDAEPIMRNIIQQAGGFEVAIALYRKNDHRRANAKTNPYALAAWCWRVLGLANSQGFSTQYEAGSLSEPVLREIAQLSPAPDGPLKAREYLAELGIPLVTLRHLSKTHLDGAALKAADGRPVVGLTIRHDRLDNFWYTLLHELAHVHLHFDDDQDETYVDDLMLVNQGDPKEEAADAMASRSLIPEHLWNDSDARTNPSPKAIMDLAYQAGVHPAVAAGTARFKHQDFRLLSQFVGSGTVRHQFDI